MKITLDFTREIRLEPRWQKSYWIVRFFLYMTFILFGCFTAYRILFPSYDFNYVFGTTGLSNNIISPHPSVANQGGFQQTALLFNLNKQGDFDKADITIVMQKNSAIADNATVEVQKSFQDFFDPVGPVFGFKDGSLLTDSSNYYLVSDSKIRMFSSLEIAQAFGLSQQMFIVVSASDLKYNGAGDDITDSRSPVDDLLYIIDNNYYQVRSGQLWPFTSEKAFLSQYDKSQTIAEGQQFLATQTISTNAIGYADGTLGSNGQSVIVLSSGKYYPIDNPTTFTDLGYNWNDIVPIGSDELALYTRQKVISSTNEQHPDGTIFADKGASKYYMVSGGQKHPIPSENIVRSYQKRDPIQVSANSLTAKTIPCQFKKNPLWWQNSYTCSISLVPLNQLLGDDFQFSVAPNTANNPTSISVTLSSSVSRSNFSATVHHLLHSTTLSATFPSATQPQTQP